MPCRVLGIVILAVDLLLVVVQLALKNDFPVLVEELIEVLTLLFSAYFCGEVALRIIGQGSVGGLLGSAFTSSSAVQAGLLQEVV